MKGIIHDLLDVLDTFKHTKTINNAWKKKIEFQIAAGFSPIQPSILTLKVPRSPKQSLYEAIIAQIVFLDSHRFASFYNFDFDISCIANRSHVFI